MSSMNIVLFVNATIGFSENLFLVYFTVTIMVWLSNIIQLIVWKAGEHVTCSNQFRLISGSIFWVLVQKYMCKRYKHISL